MKYLSIIGLYAAMMMFTDCKQSKINYPKTRMDNVEEDYFGVKVKDPYRWLEDDNSEETKKWVDEQIAVTNSVLGKISFRDKVKARYSELVKYPKESIPFKQGDYYFLYKNNGEQNQSVLYFTKDLNGTYEEILDPNTMSKDGTVSLNWVKVSADNKYMAYSISVGGSDWNTIKVKDLTTKEDLKDVIEWSKFSGIAWYNNGFFYSKYPTPKDGDKLKGANKDCKIYYHTLGDAQSNDKLIYEDTKNPEFGMSVGIFKDSHYLVIDIVKSTYGNKAYLMDLKSNNKIYKLVDNFDNDYSLLDIKGDEVFIQTDKDAPNNRLVCINIKKEKMVDIIKEKDYVLSGCSIGEDKIIANYLKDAKSKVEVYDIKGKYLYDIVLPVSIATATGFSIYKGSDITFYGLGTFTSPMDIYKYDIKNNVSELYRKSQIKFDDKDYETIQVFFPSKDGVQVPMFITYKKGIKLDGARPTLMTGYGGFNISLLPRFSTNAILMMENGGVYVQVNMRGGGEYGKRWHEAGTKMNKQNVFDDFISAAEYLIANKYTSPKKLAIIGGSNGGLLIGAVVNQRPDLFRVAVPQVGVMDMLRYQHFTIGRYWATDYGTSEDSKEMFEYLYKYSPVHNVKEGVEYPAIIITTGDHDDRVVPAHSFKYAAELQAKYKGDNPVIIRINKNAGHGGGKPMNTIIDEYSDIISFIFYSMGEKI